MDFTMKTLSIIVVAIMMVAGEVCSGETPTEKEPVRLNTVGLPSSRDYLHIYFGEFEGLRAREGFVNYRFPILYVNAVRAHGAVCDDYLPHDAPSEVINISSYDGFSGHTKTRASYRMDRRFLDTVLRYGQKKGIDAEAVTLFRRNGCNSHETLQFLENLLRFATDEPPIQELPFEPMPRYLTTREYALKKRQRAPGSHPVQAKQESVTLRSAIYSIAQEESDPDNSKEYYSFRQAYESEVSDLMSQTGNNTTPSILVCRYGDKDHTWGTYFFWLDARPPLATDKYIQKLSPHHPLRSFLGATDSCPANEPLVQHPLDVLAHLKIQTRSQASLAAPLITTRQPTATPTVTPTMETIMPAEGPRPVPGMNPFKRAINICEQNHLDSLPLQRLQESWEGGNRVSNNGKRQFLLADVVTGTRGYAADLQKIIDNFKLDLTQIKNPTHRGKVEWRLGQFQILKNEIDALIPRMEAFLASKELTYTP